MYACLAWYMPQGQKNKRQNDRKTEWKFVALKKPVYWPFMHATNITNLVFQPGAWWALRRGQDDGGTCHDLCQQTGSFECRTSQWNCRRPQLAFYSGSSVADSALLCSEWWRSEGKKWNSQVMAYPRGRSRPAVLSLGRGWRWIMK